MTIKQGDKLFVRTATDEWLPAIAASAPEGTHRDGKKIHDFPVVWVCTTPGGTAVAWPLEDVRHAEENGSAPNG